MNLQKAVKAAHAGAALFDLSDSHGLIFIEGRDRERFLQSLTTNDVEAMEFGSSQRSALLDTKSRIIADFYLHKLKSSIFLFVARGLIKPVMETLEKYHFAEDISFGTRSASILALQGDRAGTCLSGCIENFAELDIAESGVTADAEIDGNSIQIVNRSLTGDEGYLILADEMAKEQIIGKLTGKHHSNAAVTYSSDVLEILRIEAGLIEHGKDFDGSTLLLELNLGEKIFSKTKGCYPGQEIVARILSRGRMARMLTGLISADPEAFVGGGSISYDGKEIGLIRSTTWSPTLGMAIAITNLKRDYSENGAEFNFEIHGRTINCKVTRLPFYFSPRLKAEAEHRYHLGLRQYHDNLFENAKLEFEKAIAIDENYADAWEALAMTVEKMGALDEAIRLNKRYAELDLSAVMAHTNLSRLYMLKGFKDRAEEEQGKATLIKFKLKAGKQRSDAGFNREFEENRQAARKAELDRKLAIFNQVLEMDQEDEIANFGIGKIYLEMGEYERSIFALRKVISNNDKYSAAYEMLSRAYIKSGNIEEAGKVLTAGIIVAESNGDLMPMKSMQAMLASLYGNDNN